jgi:hypothetical protein
MAADASFVSWRTGPAFKVAILAKVGLERFLITVHKFFEHSGGGLARQIGSSRRRCQTSVSKLEPESYCNFSRTAVPA